MEDMTPGKQISWVEADAEGLIVEMEATAGLVEALVKLDEDGHAGLAREMHRARSIAFQLRAMLEECALAGE